jgi:hypothetical protein
MLSISKAGGRLFLFIKMYKDVITSSNQIIIP